MTKTQTRTRVKLQRGALGRSALHVLPLHHRVYIVLRNRLAEGVYPSDRPMPGEHSLAQDFETSRVTIRRVLDRLRREGLIDRRHGAGTFPLARPEGGSTADMSYYDYIAFSSHGYDAVLLDFKRMTTPAFLTSIDPGFGSCVLKILRVTAVKGIPHHLVLTYVPASMASGISRRTVGNKTLLELLKRKGVVPAGSELRIGAVAAEPLEARHLQVPVGVPLVRAIRVSRLDTGEPVEYTQILSVATLFGYRFSFDGRVGTVNLPPVTAKPLC